MFYGFEKLISPTGLRFPAGKRLTILAVYVVFLCLIDRHGFAAGAPALDHADGPVKGSSAPLGSRPDGAGGAAQAEEADACTATPGHLAAFSQGESSDITDVVAYVSSSACDADARKIATRSVALGVNFSDKLPFRLDNYAKATSRGDWESMKRMDAALVQAMPAILSENPMTSQDLKEVGQAALISREAARLMLTNYIQTQLYTGDQVLQSASNTSKPLVATDLAKTLVKLGAAETSIAGDIADAVENLALIAQSDSLAKIFRALAAAATVESSLAPTFNLSAGALNRGIQAAKAQFSKDQRKELVLALYSAIKATLSGSGSLEPGAVELNDAVDAIIREDFQTLASLKRIWHDVVLTLTTTSTQKALADAVASSLTPDVVYLSPADREQLIAAAKNYPQIGSAIQTNFLVAWERVWSDLQSNKISPKSYNGFRKSYFEPLVAGLLDLEPSSISPQWLKEVARRGMISDDDVEKKFPRLVLAVLLQREKSSQDAVAQSGARPVMASLAQDFNAVWTLSNVHMPVLLDWVKRNE